MMTNMARKPLLEESAAFATGAALIAGLSGCKPTKIRIAFVGAGGPAQGHFSDCANEDVVALDDASESAEAEGFKTFPKAKIFRDLRDMFDKIANVIDAVIIAMHDHIPFAGAMAAIQLGKHVIPYSMSASRNLFVKDRIIVKIFRKSNNLKFKIS